MTRSLPPGRTRFIGRTAERALLRELLQVRGARLVTLLGPPGTGKTRLALEVARDLTSSRDVWVCDLSAAASVADAALALAHALEIELPERSDLKTATAALARSLGAMGDKLLVLDNLEQLLPDVRALLEGCLDAGEHVSLLCTSRQRVDVAGERCFTLAPLDSDDASALFLERSRAAGVELGAEAAGVVRELVTRLDGIPLAIELAAARARVLSPQRLLERLEKRLELLTGSSSDLPTLEEAIRLSWDRLSQEEQRGLARSSVFAGGFSLDAAEAVLEDEGVTVVDVLQALVDRSLLTTSSTSGGEVRFRLLENVRAFTRERLQELSLEEEARARQAVWLAAESERRLVPLRVSQPAAVLAWLQTERDNLLAVVRRPTSRLSARRASALAALALHQLLRERGPAELHLEILEHARALLPDLGDDLARKVHAAVTLARRDDHGWERTLDELRALRSRASAASDHDMEADLDRAAGEMLFLQGQQKEAIASFRAGIAVYAAEGAREGVAQLKTLLGAALIADGAGDEAERVLLEAVRDADALDLPRVAARAEYRLGVLEHQRGEHETASSRYEAALERLGERSGDLELEAGIKHKLAALHHERGELDAAVALFEEAASLYETVGSAWHVGATLTLLAAATADLGDLDEAVRIARRGEAVLEAPGPPSVGFAAAWLGAIECRRGEAAAARAAFARAHAALDDRGDAYDRAVLEILEAHLLVIEETEVLARLAPRAALGVSPRYALHFLERSLKRDAGESGGARRPARPAGALVVASDCRWFEAPGGARVDVAKKRVLRRLLTALVERRFSSPGDVVKRAELLDAGWPGERMRPDSALSRLYVSVASLRRLGLEEALLTAGDGYLLDPGLPLTRERSTT